VPFIQGELSNARYNPIAFLGFLGSVFVTKVRGRKELGGSLDDDVPNFTGEHTPLKGLVVSKQTQELIVNGMHYLLIDTGPHTRRENGDIVLSIGQEMTLELDTVCVCHSDTIDAGRKTFSSSHL